MREFVVVAFTLALAFTASAQSARDASTLTQLLNEFLAGASRNDAAVHDRFWAADLIYTRAAGVRITKAELMKGVRSAPAPRPDGPKTVFTADQITVQQYGTTAIVAFRLVSTTVDQGKTTVAYNLNTGTFLKRKGIWQAVAWQSTAVPKK
jgi:hypothetical protein